MLARFSPPVAEWFRTTFALPTRAQAQGWPAIADREHTLICAPTGSGKTLTAFLHGIDRLMTSGPPAEPGTRLLYVSPLKALATDVDRNLRAPLHGIRLAAERLGVEVHVPTVGVRTGDTPAAERDRMRRTPPDILITTPESLFLYLTSRARETLRTLDTVIVDEIHAMAARKRGTHLALSLERLEEEVLRGGTDAFGTSTTEVTREGPDGRPALAPQRIALSATQRPLSEVALFLGGARPDPEGEADPDTGRVRMTPRPVTIVDAGVRKRLDVEVVVPVEDMAELGTLAPPEPTGGPASVVGTQPQRRSIWPAMHPELLDLVLSHRSTLVFVNARRLAERLAARLNELHHEREVARRLEESGLSADDEAAAPLLEAPVEELVRAHHGSLSKDARTRIEDDLKAGRLRGLVATSSLELGIDMGAIDLVVQVASPGAVSRGLQRIGRAGHQVGAPSRGKLFPKFRGDLVETAVVVQRMRAGEIESTRFPRNPLDVLAQQVVAMSAMDDWDVDALTTVVRRAAPYTELSTDVLHATLDLLAGRYPSDEFAELRPRIVWDRVAGTVRGRRGAQRLAVTNPGTIPDRGLFGVFTPEGGRVGELDEEMVHESRVGETFVLGASTWRIEDITYDRVVVTPAPGEPGKLPFWHGDGPGRPYELGRALGTFLREVDASAQEDPDGTLTRLREEHALDRRAADNLLSYLAEQREATGVLPTDRTIVVERFRDEIGDWRVCVLSPFGAQVHAPWAMAIERALIAQGTDPEVMWADDGIVLRIPETFDDPFDLLDPYAESAGGGAPADGRIDTDVLLVDPDEVDRLVTEQLAGTALYTTAFREAAGRALLLPKRRPDQRTALWQQRQRAADLLQVASRYPTFPLLLEATREILQDVFDLPALRRLLGDLRSRRVRVVEVESEHASPFASSLLFSWVGQYMYEYDAPLAERRAAALSLDRDLLRELLGGDELRDLLDAEVLAELELELQRLTDDRRARDADELHDVLRTVGDLTPDELVARATGDADAVAAWVDELVASNRAIRVRVADQDRVAAAEDAARLRDALGVALPPGLPTAFTDPVDDPMVDLVARYARTHGPFHPDEVAARLGSPLPRVTAALGHLRRTDRVLEGEFRPGGSRRELVDAEVLRRLRRRSLANLRAEVEPVEATALARFLPEWHGVGVGGPDPRPPERAGIDGLAEVVGILQGLPIPASVLERDVLPDRLRVYRPTDLDELVAAGEVVWFGAGSLGTSDGRVVLCFRDQAHLLAPAVGELPPADSDAGATHAALLAHLTEAGASFWPELLRASGVPDQQEVLAALWDLVWAGRVTNDTLQPVRGLLGGSGTRRPPARRGGRPRPGALRRVGPPSAAGRWSLTDTLAGRTRAGGADDPQRDTLVGRARAEQLLERHGVVTAEGVRGEGHPGGFAGVYAVLRTMEETGAVRRGYFVEGLGGAQFAAAGAIDRLRSLRDDAGGRREHPTVVTLAATDPAQPYGAALEWPESEGRPARQAGAYVVLVDGVPAVYLERGGRSLVTFPATTDTAEVWVEELKGLVARQRLGKLEVTKVDGADVHDAGVRDVLERAGFTVGYRGLTYRGDAGGRSPRTSSGSER
ncbi:MAG: DEAD/DEAH box helicase [Actinomycetes bacterium]